MLDLNGKIAVVTGASRGLGRRVALRLARHGARVALVARNASALEEVRLHMSSKDAANALCVPVDLAEPDAVAQMKEDIGARLGMPSILVNAAGIFGPIDLIKDGDPRAWIETITVNAVSPYLTCRAFVGGMIAQGWGRIINVTSAAALHEPGPVNSAYATSKAALNQMTRHLAAELAGTGVTANVIHPGDVKTDMWAEIKSASERLGSVADAYVKWAQWVETTGGDDPEKAADLVADLVSDAAATINGRFLWIKDGLQAPVPSWNEPVEVQPWRK
ncbi:hypothetical protein CIC12_20140 [Burkholderia sp. SG-MS1]|uniref:SDR family NAD(P)-dependent oxidoreductase n=1 Tax=Paraburkholderia sp. SG-MS1 TaxID=2023741 RepID=UPI001446A82B|nr:SDR family oxidoreductase [Paraburkholderia sp. SG-MS1]NKJ49004.1 hypothetical protein [Paraburkholderia sp. SG-MS1]